MSLKSSTFQARRDALADAFSRVDPQNEMELKGLDSTT